MLTPLRPRFYLPEDEEESGYSAGLQNAVAVLAVMAAIAMLVLTLVSPRASLLLIETPAAYTEAS